MLTVCLLFPKNHAKSTNAGKKLKNMKMKISYQDAEKIRMSIRLLKCIYFICFVASVVLIHSTDLKEIPTRHKSKQENRTNNIIDL